MIGRRSIAVMLALVITLSSLCSIDAKAREDTKSKLNKAQQEKNQTEQQLNQTKGSIDDMNDAKSSLEGTLDSLNDQLSEVSDNLADLEGKISDQQDKIDSANADIKKTEDEVTEAKAVKDAQYEAMKKQVRFQYEQGTTLYMEILLKSGNFSDIINRDIYIEDFASYQQKVLKNYKEAQADLEQKQKKLEEAKASLEADKKKMDEYQAKVQAQQSKISGMVSTTSGNISAYSSQISSAEQKCLEYEQQIQAQNDNIANLKAQLAKEEAMTQLAAQSSWRDISQVQFADGDRYLLANLIYCEAGGEPYTGQVAVGSVVMNRVLSAVFPDTVVGVIYQRKQFSPVASGRLALALAEGRATASCYQAADEAMSGTTVVSDCLFFRTPIDGISPRYAIGGHIFY